jgi:hypothetical protein
MHWEERKLYREVRMTIFMAKTDRGRITAFLKRREKFASVWTHFPFHDTTHLKHIDFV